MGLEPLALLDHKLLEGGHLSYLPWQPLALKNVMDEHRIGHRPQGFHKTPENAHEVVIVGGGGSHYIFLGRWSMDFIRFSKFYDPKIKNSNRGKHLSHPFDLQRKKLRPERGWDLPREVQSVGGTELRAPGE